jgi:hypothetical protein
VAKGKKIINDPRHLVPEALEGLVAASGGRLRLVDGTTAVFKAPRPRPSAPMSGAASPATCS